jgi:transposase
MDRASLERMLELGLSREQIGKRFGRDPSTVGYWLRKYGLRAVHAERHSHRGGLDRQGLETLIESGASHAAMAQELGVSPTTVKYWLAKYDLRTRQSIRRMAGREAKAAGRVTATMVCARHGPTEFWLEGRGAYRCLACRSERVAERRRKVKEILVAEAGGRCRLCGYRRSVAALHFHHVDPSGKRFALGREGITRSLAEMRAEAAKCVLLCANCHAEVEAGIVEVREVASAA